MKQGIKYFESYVGNDLIVQNIYTNLSQMDEKTIKDIIIARIDRELKVQGISQAELGRLAGGIPRVHINNYLRGTGATVSIDRLITMAEALGLEVDVQVRKPRP